MNWDTEQLEIFSTFYWFIFAKKNKESLTDLINLLETIRTMQINMIAKLKSNEYGNVEALRQDSKEIRKFTERAHTLAEDLSQQLEKSAEHRAEESDALRKTMSRLLWGLVTAVAFCGVLLGLSVAVGRRYSAPNDAAQAKPVEVLSRDEKQWLAEMFAQERETPPLDESDESKDAARSRETGEQKHTTASPHSRDSDN